MIVNDYLGRVESWVFGINNIQLYTQSIYDIAYWVHGYCGLLNCY